jgi:hypothetical protein
MKSGTKERPFSDLCQLITYPEGLSLANRKAVRVIVALLLVELRVDPGEGQFSIGALPLQRDGHLVSRSHQLGEQRCPSTLAAHCVLRLLPHQKQQPALGTTQRDTHRFLECPLLVSEPVSVNDCASMRNWRHIYIYIYIYIYKRRVRTGRSIPTSLFSSGSGS